ncbi:MAG: class I SAM-dependent methyltransferase [Pseudomonadota bacterium]|nr:MAG: SAM-dependent methyltransferase [Pseudomonadota bacterium]
MRRGRTVNGEDRSRITTTTLRHYDAHAEAFWAGTRDHDVSQNIEALLGAIEAEPPFTLLDLGCGPGRDLKAFNERGHVAIGLDGAPRFCEMARAYSGCEVWQQDFLALELPAERFDGIYANASLFHAPLSELPRVLAELRAALKPRGVLFSSNPRGQDEAGWVQGRYGVFHAPESWLAHVRAAGFELIDAYYRPPGLPRERQPWFASVWRKAGA